MEEWMQEGEENEIDRKEENGEEEEEQRAKRDTGCVEEEEKEEKQEEEEGLLTLRLHADLAYTHIHTHSAGSRY